METSFFCADSLVLSTSGLIGLTPIIPKSTFSRQSPKTSSILVFSQV